MQLNKINLFNNNSTMQKRQQKSTKNKKRPQKLSQVMPVVASNFRSLSLVFPPRMNVKLKYWGIQVLSLAAATNANYRWRPTAAFDIDPALGGTSMAGFAELAGFYASYRVVSSRIKVTLANPSVLGTITMIVLPMNADPTNSFSAANVIASVGNPYAKTKLVGLLGAPPTVIQNVMTTTKIFGDPSVFL